MNFFKKAILTATISLLIMHTAWGTQFADTLDPSDKHSPRETMESFLENVDLSYRYIMEANDITAQSGSFLFHPPQALSKARKANIYLNRAVQCLDLSEIPEVYRDEIGRERALMLKEILDRIPVPESQDIPGTKEMASKPIPRWRIPGTEIRLERVSSGEQEGYFLFSAATVDKIPFFYSLVKNMPYKNEFTTSQGFFDWYNDTPGHLFPPRWSLFLPKWSMITIGGNTLWQWFSLIIIIF